MPYAVIDTETSGLFDFSQPADAEGQPRLASFAMILLDEHLVEKEVVDLLVKPEGWSMSPEVTAIHGLTNEYLHQRGLPVRACLDRYRMAIDTGYTIAAFNAQYDSKVMRGELRRMGQPDFYGTTATFCAMRACADFVPKDNGKRGNPNLAETCRFLGIDQPGAHSALGDAWSVVYIMRKLKQLGKL